MRKHVKNNYINNIVGKSYDFAIVQLFKCITTILSVSNFGDSIFIFWTNTSTITYNACIQNFLSIKCLYFSKSLKVDITILWSQIQIWGQKMFVQLCVQTLHSDRQMQLHSFFCGFRYFMRNMTWMSIFWNFFFPYPHFISYINNNNILNTKCLINLCLFSKRRPWQCELNIVMFRTENFSMQTFTKICKYKIFAFVRLIKRRSLNAKSKYSVWM